MKRFSFPKKKRIITNEQFKAVLDRNLRVRNGLLTLYVAENNCGYPRLGISIGKSCGNAVVRNRLKRLLRDIFRNAQGQIPASFDYVIAIPPQWPRKLNSSLSPQKAAKELKSDLLKASFLSLVAKAAEKIII